MYDVHTIPTDKVNWTDITRESPDQQFRISTRRGIETLWRKQNHPAFYGGHQIKLVPLDSRLAREWLDAAGYDTFALNMASKH
jgi:hypothetical protein